MGKLPLPYWDPHFLLTIRALAVWSKPPQAFYLFQCYPIVAHCPKFGPARETLETRGTHWVLLLQTPLIYNINHIPDLTFALESNEVLPDRRDTYDT